MARQLINAGGEQFVLVPLAEYERLAKIAKELAGDFTKPVPATEFDAKGPVPEEGESRLRAWRKYRGLTQEQLSVAAGVRASRLSDIESGKYPGPVEQWVRLAKALGTTVEDLQAKEE